MGIYIKLAINKFKRWNKQRKIINKIKVDIHKKLKDKTKVGN